MNFDSRLIKRQKTTFTLAGFPTIFFSLKNQESITGSFRLVKKEFLICIVRPSWLREPLGASIDTEVFATRPAGRRFSLSLIYLDRCDGIKSSASFLFSFSFFFLWGNKMDGRVSVVDDSNGKRKLFPLFFFLSFFLSLCRLVSEIYRSLVVAQCWNGRRTDLSSERESF